jgi:hypothetical protein
MTLKKKTYKQQVRSHHHKISRTAVCSAVFNIQEKSMSGESQCLVWLCAVPFAVCRGIGASPEEAQPSAVQNALDYLKIVTNQ